MCITYHAVDSKTKTPESNALSIFHFIHRARREKGRDEREEENRVYTCVWRDGATNEQHEEEENVSVPACVLFSQCLV